MLARASGCQNCKFRYRFMEIVRMSPTTRPKGAARATLRVSHEAAEAGHAQGLLAALLASSSDAIIAKDLNGVVTSWNPAATRLFGFTAEDMVGASILRIIPPELHEEEDRILALV